MKLLILLLIPCVSWSFTISNPEFEWEISEFDIYFNTANCPSGFESAVNSAVEVWDVVPFTSFKINLRGATSSTVNDVFGGDATETVWIGCDVNFANGNYSSNVTTGSLAIAGHTVTSASKYFRSYVIFNMVSGSLGDNTNRSQTEITKTMIHELGHVWGLGHSPNPETQMYPTAVSTRPDTLSQDDILGIQYLFPRNEISGDQLAGCGTIATPTPPINGFLLLIPLIVGIFGFKGRRKKLSYA